jgi:thioredoxin reductase (NADPH)
MQSPTPADPAADPELSDGQLARLRAYGSPDELEVGEAAFESGDPTYDLIVIEQGVIELLLAATVNAPEASLRTFRPGAFVAELGILTGQTTYLRDRGCQLRGAGGAVPGFLRPAGHPGCPRP